MKNRIRIEKPAISGNRIDYAYIVEGEWACAFRLKETFFIEYSFDVSGVPDGVAVVPLLTNILPVAWVYDAEIIVNDCDEDFFHSVGEFKQGFTNMYPMISFKGKLTANNLTKNRLDNASGALAYFSGGVDSFDTLISHADERPTLVTVWGSDILLKDVENWEKVQSYAAGVAHEFEIDLITIRTSFKRILESETLNQKIAPSGDRWWHGFQHGIGFVGLAAPAAYALRRTTVYFASTFCEADKGKVTCGSDESIDGRVRFAGARVVHDGYGYPRQAKVRNIVQYAAASGRKVSLRVCWASKASDNCCRCEKCFRTMTALYAENADPHAYGFHYDERTLNLAARDMRVGMDPFFDDVHYRPIHEAMRRNCRSEKLPRSLRWFYEGDIGNLLRDTLLKQCLRGIIRFMRRIRRVSRRFRRGMRIGSNIAQ